MGGTDIESLQSAWTVPLTHEHWQDAFTAVSGKPKRESVTAAYEIFFKIACPSWSKNLSNLVPTHRCVFL
jgi:hypothetical protein